MSHLTYVCGTIKVTFYDYCISLFSYSQITKALVARNYYPLSEYLFIFNKISLLFHLMKDVLADQNLLTFIQQLNHFYLIRVVI